MSDSVIDLFKNIIAIEGDNIETKDELLVNCTAGLCEHFNIEKYHSVLESIIEREEVGSTGIGHGVAMPHAKCAEVNHLCCAICITKKGIDYDSLDHNPVYTTFLVLAPRNGPGQHLKMMTIITRLLSKYSFRKELLLSENSQAALTKLLKQLDREFL